jgi:hypothetical protein
MIVAVSSLVVALAAVAVTIWQGMLTRKHNRLSVLPRLRIDFDHPTGGEVVVTLMNTGLGPAVINSYEVRVDGAPSPVSGMLRLGHAVIGLGLVESFYAYAPAPSDVFAAGEKRTLLSFRPAKDNDQERDRIHTALARVTLDFAYESMYGDKQQLVITAIGMPGK